MFFLHYGIGFHFVTKAFALERIKVKYDYFPLGLAFAITKEGECDGSVYSPDLIGKQDAIDI